MYIKTASRHVFAVSILALIPVAAANAQWASGGSGFNVGVGGSYSKVKLPDGRTTSSTNVNWGAGFSSGSSYGTGGGYGVETGYGMSGIGYGGLSAGGYGGVRGYVGGCGYGGGYGYGNQGYGGCSGAVVLPYYGGGCSPVVVPYSPFTRGYATPCYSPQYPIAPAAALPQSAICW
jgi:hypothetical protein